MWRTQHRPIEAPDSYLSIFETLQTLVPSMGHFLALMTHLVCRILSPPLLWEFPKRNLIFQHGFLHLLLPLPEENLSNGLGTDLCIISLTFFLCQSYGSTLSLWAI